MAFAYTVTSSTVAGNKKIVWGTYTNTGGSTGGDVTTGLNQVDAWLPVSKGSSVVATAPAVNETFPLANTGGAVTIVTTADDVGYWVALGN